MQKIKEFLKNKTHRQLLYFVLTAFMIISLWLMGQAFNVNHFLESIELKTLDFRFGITHKAHKHNDKVVILSIDDNSIELLADKYGRWPWSRNAYTEAINYLESEGVDSVIFDIMFIGKQKGFENHDLELAKTIAKNNNVYVSMNFDAREVQNPPKLPDRLKVKVDNKSKKTDLSYFDFTNSRLIMDEILNSDANIGIINFARDDDGISRRSPIFIKYFNDYYPYLGFKAAADYLKKHENVDTSKFVVNQNNQLELGKRKIQLDDNGLMLLNWYGPDKTFEYIPFWQISKSIDNIEAGKEPVLPKGYFKDKVVFVGVSAVSLFDIKVTPLSSIYPGVEIQATVFNNLVDGKPIKRAGTLINLLICISLSIIVGLAVIKQHSSLVSSFITVFTAALYVTAATLLMKHYQLWIGMVNQLLVITLTFTFMYVIKYLMKSRDFEYTYKLATTDGLTGLYNHRYFQECMKNLLDRGKRYNTPFSLLLFDIDFFKKFNDTYGHQAGDAVLKQVAETLKKTVRSTDIVARYGGEEMAVILENTDLEEAVITANKLCKTIAEKTFKLSESVEVHVTVSIGVSTFPKHGETPAELIEFSDQGLYRAKKGGRNQVGELPEIDPKEQIPEEPELNT